MRRFRARHLWMVPLAIAGVAVLGWMVMALWNAVVPALFVGARSIDFLHALGLLVLSRILFGGFRGRGGRGGCHGRHWRKWEAMTPEEREQFQQTLHARWRSRKGEDA